MSESEHPTGDRSWLALDPQFPLEDEHVIRLRGPWRYLAADGRSGTVRLPASWSAIAGHSPSLSLARHFHRPTGLESHEVVWLAVEGIAPTAVRLNGECLVDAGLEEACWCCDVTRRLALRNELMLEFPWPLPEGQTGEELDVGLVIRSE